MSQLLLKTLKVKESTISTSTRINEAIRAKELRVIGANGEQLGIMSRLDALNLAHEAGVDLVEFSPNANPPVVKVIDWGKYQYQKMKEQQKNRRSNKASELKQMRFGLKIGSNDLEIKLRKIRKFLSEGHKVKILIFFRGREMAHKELGYVLIEKVASALEDEAVVEQKPLMAGRNLSIVIRSK
ncbi:MAG: translation initiation factor IF-3 [Candidatus Saccharimonas sp.]